MKITDIECHVLLVPDVRKDVTSSAQDDIVVRVHTDEGITGIGEGVGNAPLIKSIIESSLGPEAIGLNPMNIEQLREAFYTRPVYFERKGSNRARKAPARYGPVKISIPNPQRYNYWSTAHDPTPDPYPHLQRT